MRQLAELLHDKRGSVAITAGILAPLLVGAAGMAVIYTSANAGKTGIQATVDAAVLAGASLIGTSSEDPVTAARNAFGANVARFAAASLKDIQADFSLNDEILSGTARGRAPNPFAGVLGRRTLSPWT